MKIVRKTLLAAAIASTLAACSEDYNAPSKSNEFAPEHGGNIAVTAHEKDGTRLIYLLGDLEGNAPELVNGVLTINGGAVDRDGDPLIVSDITMTLNGEAITSDHILVEAVNTDKVKVTPTALAADLDTGDTAVLEVNYVISDLVNTVTRSAVISITGEDFAPEVDGDLTGNFTRDAGTGKVDLLARTSDDDGEALNATNLVADAGNPLVLPATINSNNELELDIAAIESEINDGERLTFNFSVDIEDHNNAIPRNITVNVLGVKDVPGAPLIENYFLTAAVMETGSPLVVDLTQTVIEREGDAIVAHDILLNDSSDLPFGVEVVGNQLEFDPHAFFHEIGPGEIRDFNFSFKISDDQGNTSDGTRELLISLTGEETNLITTAGYATDFEDPSHLGTVTAGNSLGYGVSWGHGSCDAAVEATAARSSDAGLKLVGSACHLTLNGVIPAVEAGEKYLSSYWFQNLVEAGDPHGNPYVPLIAPNASSTNIWDQARHEDRSVNGWQEQVNFLSTDANSGLWGPDYVGEAINMNIFKIGSNSYGEHHIDDLNLIAYGGYDVAAHDVMADDVGAFDGELSAISFNAGTVEIQTVDGNNVLYVNASVDEDISIQLPIKDGAIQPNHRYMLSADVQAIGGTDATQIWVNVTNGTERVDGHTSLSTSDAAWTATDVLISEADARTADVDWSTEMMSLTLYIAAANNSEYYIDNVRLIELP